KNLYSKKKKEWGLQTEPEWIEMKDASISLTTDIFACRYATKGVSETPRYTLLAVQKYPKILRIHTFFQISPRIGLSSPYNEDLVTREFGDRPETGEEEN
ncbi:hypothetical protein AVEN_110339-1, partial [Araneus ventricosus]